MAENSRRNAGATAAILASILALFAALAGKPALAQGGAQESAPDVTENKVLSDGRLEFEANCMTCHGPLAHGDGPVADILLVRPPDLTQIAKRRGGNFPFWTVYDLIAGVKPIRAHQFSGMPHWTERFRAEEETRVVPPQHIRILLLTHYLESIQEK
jgi:mono/diheme cytochrome c family protein